MREKAAMRGQRAKHRVFQGRSLRGGAQPVGIEQGPRSCAFAFILILPATHKRWADLEIPFESITDWTVVQFQRKIEQQGICVRVKPRHPAA